MKKLLILTASLILPLSAHAVLLTGFGSGDFTVTGGGSLSYSQSSSSLTIDDNNDIATLFGNFSTADISGQTTFYLTASLSGTNPSGIAASPTFNVILTDTGNQQWTLTGNWSSFTSTPQVIELSAGTPQPTFDPTQVNSIDFVADLTGTGGSSFTFTFDELTAVPEPGTWLLFSMGAAGLAAISRRRRR